MSPMRMCHLCFEPYIKEPYDNEIEEAVDEALSFFAFDVFVLAADWCIMERWIEHQNDLERALAFHIWNGFMYDSHMMR